MRYNSSCLLLVFLLISTIACGQKEANNWLFGTRGWLDFNSGTAVFRPGASFGAREGCSSISDAAGNLLFSTNGTNVWNKNNAFIGNIGPSGIASSTQAALIVPHPGNDSIFYVFISAQIEFTATQGLFYAIINMKMNGGLGGIMQTYVTLYPNHIHEKIAAVKHKNGHDIWLLTHVAGSNQFLEYRITNNGLDINPVIIQAGGTTDSFLDRMGYLKFSADGSRIAMACTESRLEIFRFDNETGTITDPKIIPRFPNTNCRGFYGAEFSCDSKLLYASYFFLCSTGSAMVYLLQYKIDYPNVNDIINSRVFLDSALSSSINYGALQMSPDGKILVSTASENYIGAILKPNVYGTGCTFVPQYVTFPVTSTCELGLPNMVQSYYHSDSLSMKSSGNCSSKNVLFDIEHLNIYDSIRWDFGDPASGAANYSSIINPGHLFSANGFYTVTVLVYKSCKTDTLQKFISVGDTHTMLGIDTSICPNSTFTPRVTVSGASYEWQDGSTADSFKITGPGIYWVKIKLDNCISTDSLIVTGKPSPVFDLGNDRHICENSSVLLDLTGTGDSYLWQDNSTAPVYNVSKAGLYFVKVTKGSCSITDSVKISILLIPRPNLGPDISICRGAPVLLNPGTFEGSYLWQDGASTLTYSPTQSGSYSVTISNNCATGTDDINVVLSPCDVYIPNAFTPNEDGKNDEFKVAIYGTVNSFRLEVFNRYGALIFVSSDPSTGWDGWYKNKPQPSGAYTWHCVYQLQGKVLTEDKGTVLLVR